MPAAEIELEVDSQGAPRAGGAAVACLVNDHSSGEPHVDSVPAAVAAPPQRRFAVAGWVKQKYLQQTDKTERLALATSNGLETVAAFGLSRLDQLLDDGDDTQPRLTVRKEKAAGASADMTEEMVRKGITSGQVRPLARTA